MRKTVTLGMTAVALWAMGCSSSSSGSTDTCAFAKDTTSCWHTFVKSVDDCLSDDAGSDAGPRPRGTMSADGKSCTYPTGRNVTFALDPRVQETSGSTPDRDFTVTFNGATCLHMVRNKDGMSFTGPGGTLTESSNGTVTCPDGSTHTLGIDVTNCLDAAFAGGLPGYVSSSSTTSWYLSLAGSSKPAYDCSNASPSPTP